MSTTDIINIINIIGLFATATALALAIWQTLLARRQKEEARLQTEKLSFISDALSTRYLGMFPEYFPQLNSLIEDAKHELLILSTLPTHGVFSDHDGWLKRKHALEDAIHRRVKVRCIFADTSHREEHRRNQFRDALANWSAWRSNPANAARLQQIVESFGDGGSIQ